jgi:hypothetical protein
VQRRHQPDGKFRQGSGTIFSFRKDYRPLAPGGERVGYDAASDQMAEAESIYRQEYDRHDIPPGNAAGAYNWIGILKC